MNNVYNVVMAGGIGSRFWPMSRQSKPKQFLDILGTGKSLIQMTHERLAQVGSAENFLIVTSDEYLDLCAEHLPSLGAEKILAEPMRKNTAPCIAYAAYKIHKTDPDAVMVVSPADHIILKEDEFKLTLEKSIDHAVNTGHLVTIGIKPTRPDSGYGYIQFFRDKQYGVEDIQRVKTFTEKPSVELALQFLQSGDFYWNSGMFVWKVSSIIEAFEQLMPDLAKMFEEQSDRFGGEEETAAIDEIYSQCPNISIDYGIMEKAKNVDVVLGDFGWSDLGTWGSLYEQLVTEDAGNVSLSGQIRSYDSSNSIIKAPKDKLVVIQGLNNYIVIDEGDVLLVCQKGEEQKIKQFVNDLKAEKKTDFI